LIAPRNTVAAAPREPENEAELVLRVTGSAFLWCGASMVLATLLLGGWHIGNPVLWIGLFCLVSGSTVFSASLAVKRIRGQAKQLV